ncbi:hypothetical protein ILUMI_23354 [Ignelater luminosus]|uniref:Serine protease gd N-terminal domain-containing protein n=1 Tax=Ignelater luminosus TaxID=2038154 RepID=A0A8K0CCN6_IGNLU|nr:hypothetical protein ILUMI_23354 [Ignelater luminosus]
MLFSKTFVAVVFFILNEQIIAQNNNDSELWCPSSFVYEGKKNESDKWYGSVTLVSENDLVGIWLSLIFDRPSLLLANWFGEVETIDNKEYLIENRNFYLKANVPQTVKFYVKYNETEPIPKLISFRLNARTVCSEGVTTELLPPATSQLQASDAPGANSVTTASPPRGNGRSEEGRVSPSGGNFPWLQEPFPSDKPYPGDFNLFGRLTQRGPVDDTDINSICGTVVVSIMKDS